MAPNSTILVLRVPSSISEKDIVQYIQAQCGENSIAQMNRLLPKGANPSSPSHIIHQRIVLKTPEMAKILVEKKVLPISGVDLTVQYFKTQKEIKDEEEATVVSIEGLDGENEDQISEAFSRFGSIEKIELNKGNTLSFVTYQTFGCAVRAQKELDDKLIGEHIVKVKLVLPETPSSSSSDANESIDGPILAANKLNVIIKGTPLTGMSDGSALEEVCKSFGACTLMLKDDVQHPDRRLAFVTFESEEGASKCIEAMNGKPLPESVVSLLMKKREEERAKRGAGEKTQAELEEEEKMKTSGIVVEYVKEGKKASPSSSASSPASSSSSSSSSTSPSASSSATSSTLSANATPFGGPRHTASSSSSLSSSPAQRTVMNGLFLVGFSADETEATIRQKLRPYGNIVSIRFTGMTSVPSEGRPSKWRATVFMENEKQAEAVLTHGVEKVIVTPYKTMEERQKESQQHMMEKQALEWQFMQLYAMMNPAFAQGQRMMRGPVSDQHRYYHSGHSGSEMPYSSEMMESEMQYRSRPQRNSGDNQFFFARQPGAAASAGAQQGMNPMMGSAASQQGMPLISQAPQQRDARVYGAGAGMRRADGQVARYGTGRNQAMAQSRGGMGGRGREQMMMAQQQQQQQQMSHRQMAAQQMSYTGAQQATGMGMRQIPAATQQSATLMAHSTATAIPTITSVPQQSVVGQGDMQMAAGGVAAASGQTAAELAAQGGFDLNTLKGLDEDAQRETIGEFIYSKVEPIHGDLAGKITGMLLELDKTQLFPIVQNLKLLLSHAGQAAVLLGQK
ncbi:putative Poly-adenylate binding protein, unique domain [Monocercomonoides exilis]|uniref:putative Poly-adenylate binding protein, unique domain n=1 Tax=Monocercomonoides exilis TaxID=2049356 RepID=UPI003559852C|nr:putative Poly-adenylate binding protein, unique domain [Monocercomonoides exilis]|eukprot:MONOS_5394.1-p1 / transcript=MONOS_5394.1 / gene=MONOS_5394 / organism=Monocercomonoides_exilis_PA203 / gene_product=unspecified product / transcript_product=unspecified product / location=Mono_scaffold00156:33321-36131(+) / protein_length=793 / sequence_SO=supercontig / SO=protein_coding / is_pseudo=false